MVPAALGFLEAEVGFQIPIEPRLLRMVVVTYQILLKKN